MLAAGALIIVALVIGLVEMTRGGTEAAPAPAAARHAPAPRAPIAEAAPAAAPAAPRAEPVAAAPRRVAAMPARRPELSAPSVGFTRDLKRDANGKLVPIFPVQHLREQIQLLDAPMQACVQRAGAGITGKATLNFTVAAKNNKIFIETTGIQDEETLAAYPELLECMHQTAHAFSASFEGRAVPELGTPIYVRRHVRMDNGALAENTIFDFSYHP